MSTLSHKASTGGDPAHLSLFSVPCELLSLGDGTWRIVPGKPQEKLTVR